MANYLRPYRGKKSTAETQNIILKRGEVFFEYPDSGAGTGTGRIKVGDGTTAYASLPYFMNPDNFVTDISAATVIFTETSEANNTTLFNRIVTGAALNIITASVKNLLSNLNGSVIRIDEEIEIMQQNFQASIGDIYNACVAKGSTPASHSLSDVIAGIMAISSGIIPSGNKAITANGTGIDVTNYATVSVNVPNTNTETYTASSSSSALDMGATNNYRYVNTSSLTKVSGTKGITANGTGIDVKAYEKVNVAVPASAVVSGNKAITANGTGIDVTNYKTCSVAVPASAVVSGNKAITANGTGIDVTNYKTCSVAVPSHGTITKNYHVTVNKTNVGITYAYFTLTCSSTGSLSVSNVSGTIRTSDQWDKGDQTAAVYVE